MSFFIPICAPNPRAVAELLDRYIDPRWSVVVWFATFERGVNKEIQAGCIFGMHDKSGKSCRRNMEFNRVQLRFSERTATAAKSRLAVPRQNGTVVRLFPPW